MIPALLHFQAQGKILWMGSTHFMAGEAQLSDPPQALHAGDMVEIC